MSDFVLGLTHITDWEARSHALLVGVGGRLRFASHWQGRLTATAFTLGHSLTWPSHRWTSFEFLVLGGFSYRSPFCHRFGLCFCGTSPTSKKVTYAMAAGFGLIHGLGFSSFFRIAGTSRGLHRRAVPVQSGVEAGQLVIVAVLLAVASLVRSLGVSARDQHVFVCGGAIALSLVMALERLPF